MRLINMYVILSLFFIVPLQGAALISTIPLTASSTKKSWWEKNKNYVLIGSSVVLAILTGIGAKLTYNKVTTNNLYTEINNLYVNSLIDERRNVQSDFLRDLENIYNKHPNLIENDVRTKKEYYKTLYTLKAKTEPNIKEAFITIIKKRLNRADIIFNVPIWRQVPAFNDLLNNDQEVQSLLSSVVNEWKVII